MQVRRGRHPHEIAILLAFFVLGVLGMVLFERVSSNTLRALPEPLAYGLFAGSTISSGIGLVGVVMRRTIGALVERVGLLGLTAFGLAYVVAVLGAFGLRGYSSVAFVLIISIFNIFRVVQIGRELREYELLRTTLLSRDEDRDELGE